MLKVSELYIPIWLYSNWSINQVSNIWDILYIPIWLYSNYVRSIIDIGAFNFTFQSGYIQIESVRKIEQSVIRFTFQSGYIQILKDCLEDLVYAPLHSNLVIFKFVCIC